MQWIACRRQHTLARNSQLASLPARERLLLQATRTFFPGPKCARLSVFPIHSLVPRLNVNESLKVCGFVASLFLLVFLLASVVVWSE